MAGTALLGRLQQASGPLVGLAGLGAAAYGVSQAVYNVEGGHMGIMYSRVSGITGDVVGEGYHFKVPWVQQPIIYNVRTRAHEYPNEKTGTKDLQMVNISLRVLCRPSQPGLPNIFKKWGPPEATYQEQAFDKKVLDSILQESLKANVARFNAAQLITERDQVSRQIRTDLTDRSRDFDLVIEDVSITDLQFGRQYAGAVEQKQVAQQMAQRAEIEVDKAMQEKRQKIAEAEGETKSAALIGAAIAKSPAYLNLEKIKAAREIANTVASSQNRVYLNAGSLLLDVNQHKVNASDLNGESEPNKAASKSSMW